MTPLRSLGLALIFALPLLAVPAGGAAPANPPAASRQKLLTQRYPADLLASRLVPTKDWRLFPPAADRAAWDALLTAPLNRTRREWLVAQADALVGQPWPTLPATLYMEFARTGNRSRYQAPYFQRRANLATLVLAECLEHRGRFLDEIANGLWAISEEATWCVPAHATRLPGDVLHRQDVEGVDLFAAETAMTLATAHYLLRAELEKLSPALSDRIRREVLRRVVEPVETSDNFGRAGWLDGHNNWSPWCASNVLGAALLLVDDPARLARFSVRLMTVVDRFIDNYGEDGGCDEGPGYWNEAPGALLVFLELLHSRTQGTVDIYADPKIAAMGEFIVRAHIAGPWFVNFSDADAQTTPHAGKVWRYGERVHSAALTNLALLTQRQWRADRPVDPPLQLSGVSRALLGPLMELFWIPADAKPAPAAAALHVWLPDLQVLFAREAGAPDAGLFLAAKGGHNAESHNHNDSGHFIVFLDGQPGIVDIGREEYTAKTFSKDRYDLWFTRGLGHNAPVVNGVEQAAGREFEATQVACATTTAGVRLGMNLEKAYPTAAGLQSFRRELEFQRGPQAGIRVRDTFALKQGPARLAVPFFAARPATVVRPGLVAIACQPRRLLVEFDPAGLAVNIEPVPLQDPSLRKSWGDQLWRVAFDLKSDRPAGEFEFRFRAEPAGAVASEPTAPAVGLVRDLAFLGPDRAEKLDLYLPPRTGPALRPAVVWIHGGGWTGGTKNENRAKTICTTLAQAGYVAVSIDYRLGPGAWPTNLHDCKNAVRFLRAHAAEYHLDPERIAVAGGSAGGHLALMVGLTAGQPEFEPAAPYPGVSSTVRAIVNFYGVTNLLSRQATEQDGTPVGKLKAGGAARVFGAEAPTDDVYRLVSPVTHVAKDSPPMLTLHGRADATVDFPQAEELAAVAKERGAVHELVLLDGVGHTFDLETWNKQPLPRDVKAIVLAFLEKHLPPAGR